MIVTTRITGNKYPYLANFKPNVIKYYFRFSEDSFVRRCREELDLSMSAQNYLLKLWKIESEIRDLKPLVDSHTHELHELQHYLDLESQPLLRSWTGAVDLTFYQTMIHYLRTRLQDFRNFHTKKTRKISMKLERFHMDFQKCHERFFTNLGITKLDVMACSLGIKGQLMNNYQHYYLTAQLGEAINDVHCGTLLKAINKQYYGRFLFPFAFVLQVLLGFLLKPLFTVYLS